MNPGIVLFLVEVLCFVLGRKIGYDNGLQEGQQQGFRKGYNLAKDERRNQNLERGVTDSDAKK